MAAAKRFFDKAMGANGAPEKVAMEKSGANKAAIDAVNAESFRAAGSVFAGIELVHMIRKGQFAIDGADPMSFADQFSTLAGMVRPV